LEYLRERYGVNPFVDYRNYFRKEYEKEKSEKNRHSKDPQEEKILEVNAEDLKTKLEEIVHMTMKKTRGYFHAHVDTPFFKKNKSKGFIFKLWSNVIEEQKILMKQEKERLRQQLIQMNDEATWLEFELTS